jgi:hypothetical protein
MDRARVIDRATLQEDMRLVQSMMEIQQKVVRNALEILEEMEERERQDEEIELGLS